MNRQCVISDLERGGPAGGVGAAVDRRLQLGGPRPRRERRGAGVGVGRPRPRPGAHDVPPLRRRVGRRPGRPSLPLLPGSARFFCSFHFEFQDFLVAM